MLYRLLPAVLIGILAFAPAFAAEKEPAKPKVTNYGDWGKVCEKPPKGAEAKGPAEVCYIFQNVTNKENGKLVMQIRIGLPAGGKEPVVIATLPLGVLLPPGAALIVEGAEPLKLPFLACAPEGCTTVGQKLGDKLLKAMKKGDKGSIRVALLNRKVLALPISLKGFTRATAALTAGK